MKVLRVALLGASGANAFVFGAAVMDVFTLDDASMVRAALGAAMFFGWTAILLAIAAVKIGEVKS